MEEGLGNSFSTMLTHNAVSFKYSYQKSAMNLLNAYCHARPYAEHYRQKMSLKMLLPIKGLILLLKTRCIYQKT